MENIADHYGVYTVDLLAQFNLDPDGDGAETQEAFEEFNRYYNNDPHPNAQGFDMITERFVSSLLENSRYN